MESKRNSFKLLEKQHIEQFESSALKVKNKLNKTLGRIELIGDITEVFIPKMLNALLYLIDNFKSTDKSKK